MAEEKKKACPFRLAGYNEMIHKCSTKERRGPATFNELAERELQRIGCIGDCCQGWNTFTKSCCFRQLFRLDELSAIRRTLEEWKDKMVG
jgi:hypothetical protein